MSETIIVALLSLLGSLGGTLGGIALNSKLSKQPIGGLSNATALFVWSSDYKSGTITIPQSYINTNFEGTEYARFCLAYVDIGNIEIYNE